MRQHNVFPECNVDTNLVGFILGGYAKHKSCCNEVVKAVNTSDGFAVGIIDADKRQATLDTGFIRYNQPEEIENKNTHLTMYIHLDKKRYVFTVAPAMDQFILDASKGVGVNMKAFGYPSSLDKFKKETKRIQASSDAKLRRLFQEIIDYPELSRFRNTIKYLMTWQYDADPTVAQQFFDGKLNNDDLTALLQGVR